MSRLPPLVPSYTLAALFPSDAVYAPRTAFECVPWVVNDPWRLDTLSGVTPLIMGPMPLICHRNCLTEGIRDFFARCGGLLPQVCQTYATQDQAFALAGAWIDRGRRLACPYPLPHAVCEPKGQLVPPSLYNWLNDKSNLASLVDPEWLPPGVWLAPQALRAVLAVFPGEAVFIKACVAGASGGGVGVRHCPDQSARLAALDWLDSGAAETGSFSGLRVEQALDIPACWCLNLAVLDDRIDYLGAALQLFGSPGQQSGSRIDPAQAPPTAAVAIALQIAGKAQQMGYRGVAGFDVGVTPAGRPYVFDLNFRLVSSTVQVLLHDSAVARVGGCVSESWHAVLQGPLAPALAAIDDLACSGGFVPYRLWEANPGADSRSMITGFLVGDSLAAIGRKREALAVALARWLQQ